MSILSRSKQRNIGKLPISSTTTSICGSQLHRQAREQLMPQPRFIANQNRARPAQRPSSLRRNSGSAAFSPLQQGIRGEADMTADPMDRASLLDNADEGLWDGFGQAGDSGHRGSRVGEKPAGEHLYLHRLGTYASKRGSRSREPGARSTPGQGTAARSQEADFVFARRQVSTRTRSTFQACTSKL